MLNYLKKYIFSSSIINQLGYFLLPSQCLICSALGQLNIDLCQSCQEILLTPFKACFKCGLPISQEQSICSSCIKNPPLFNAIYSAFYYRYPLDNLLLRFKFHNDLAAGRLLSQLMLFRMLKYPRPNVIIPIPLHISRLRQRGYNQSLELVKPIANILNIPIQNNILIRKKATQAQSELDTYQRRNNIKNAFIFKGKPPAHIVLFDDVMTTGATLHEATLCALNAGVKKVDIWVCARVQNLS